MKTRGFLRCATACAALIIGPVTPYGGRLMMSDVAQAHGANGGSAGGGGHGGRSGSDVASGAAAPGRASGAAHPGMENASHHSRSGRGGGYGQYTGPGSAYSSGC